MYNDHPLRAPGALSIIGAIMFLAWGTIRVVGCINYNREVAGHLKRAADANQPLLVLEEIKTALDGMEKRGLCNEIESNPKAQCFTSVVYRTPNEDIGFWRINIMQTVGDLENLPAESSHLEVSNTLMKVRETLLDGGRTVTDPEGISIYPGNSTWAWVGLLGMLLLVGGVIWLAIRVEM